MATDDFSVPLGQQRPPHKPSFRLSLRSIATGALALTAAAVAAAGAMRTVDSPQEPPATVTAAPASAAGLRPLPVRDSPSTSAEKEAAVETAPISPPPGRVVTIIDGTTGKRREIVIPGTTDLVGFDQQAPEPPLAKAAASAPSARPPARPGPAR